MVPNNMRKGDMINVIVLNFNLITKCIEKEFISQKSYPCRLKKSPVF